MYIEAVKQQPCHSPLMVQVSVSARPVGRVQEKGRIGIVKKWVAENETLKVDMLLDDELEYNWNSNNYNHSFSNTLTYNIGVLVMICRGVRLR